MHVTVVSRSIMNELQEFCCIITSSRKGSRESRLSSKTHSKLAAITVKSLPGLIIKRFFY